MKKKTVIAMLILTAVFSVFTGAFAASNLTTITAYLNGDIKFRKDGMKWRPTDDNGREVLPITYKGTTYLPLRVIANAFDIPVLWEGTTQTIGLGESADLKLYAKQVKVDYWTLKSHDIIDKKQLVFDGKQYAGAFAYSANHERVEQYYAKFDFGQKYNTMHLIVVAEGDMKIKVYNGDNQQLSEEISLAKGEVKEFDIDLQGSRYASVFAYDADYNTSYPLVYILKDSYVK